jgi:hypothetical protein
MIKYSGNSGASMNDAVVITGARTHYESIMAEHEYIRRKCVKPGMTFTIEEQNALNSGVRHYDVVRIKLSNLTMMTVFFDVTELYDKFVIYPM